MCTFFSILNSMMEEWKCRSRELLKAFFHQKTIRKQTGSAWIFFQPPIQVCIGTYIPYFSISELTIHPPLSPQFSAELHQCLNSLVRINNINGKGTYCQLPSPAELLQGYTPIFLWTPKGLIYPEDFLNFFWKLYILPWLRKSFKLLVLRLPENTFAS